VDDGAPAAFIDAAKHEGIEIETPHAGDVFELGDGVRLEVVGPGPAVVDDRQLNNTSLVLRLVWGDVSFLFTGDIEARAEEAMIADGENLRATVLKVPHHGSATSSSPAFLAAVRPQISVISAGKDNQFGHPRPDVVDRLDDYGDVIVTAQSGAVSFETDGRRLWVDQ
jgi:competence protein ComEC